MHAAQAPGKELLLEDQRDDVVGQGHEGQRRAAHDGYVEVPGNAQRVVRHDVDLLGPENDSGDPASKAKDDQ